MLFPNTGTPFSAHLAATERKAIDEINLITPPMVLIVTEPDMWVKEIAARFKVDIPVLDEERMVVSVHELGVTTPHRLTANYYIPFKGNSWHFRHSHPATEGIPGEVSNTDMERGGHLQIVVARSDYDTDAYLQEYYTRLIDVRNVLDAMRIEAEGALAALQVRLRHAIKQRCADIRRNLELPLALRSRIA